MNIEDVFKITEQKLSKISPSFCLAKWTDITLHLHLGETQSCHHPRPHKIDKEKIEKNPSALHNSSQKIQSRQDMINGLRPAECNKCWTVEDSSEEQISDRIVKSTFIGNNLQMEKILENPFSEKFLPKLLEVGFSNICNLKCVYCGPHFSSEWKKELSLHGLIDGYYFQMDTEEEKNSPYIEAFWRWWPDLISNLRILRITGGEPLLSKSTYILLERILKGPNLDLELVLNTNLALPGKTLEKALNILENILNQKKVKKIKIITSMEADKETAEYIRFGIDINSFWENVLKIRKANFCELSITATVNILSLGNLKEFYLKVAEIKNLTKENNRFNFFIDSSLLKFPNFLNILNFNRTIKQVFLNEIFWILENRESLFLTDYESLRLKTVEVVIKSKLSEEKKEEVDRLVPYLKEIDRRRNADYTKSLPKLFKIFESEGLV